MTDLRLSFDPGGGATLTDLARNVSVSLSPDELTWLRCTLTAVTYAEPSHAMSVDDAIDAICGDDGDSIPLSEK